MEEIVVHIEGIGWWSPGVADWAGAAARLRDGVALPAAGTDRPAAAALPPSERRRAPQAVLLACEVSAQACAMAAREPADLPCVFASMHGDIVITDELCTTLAGNPLDLSPTRFHNSVHNAPAGYWTVAAHCHAASSAVSAGPGTLAAGLLEAAVQAVAGDTPVLFALHDVAPRGALAGVVRGATPFGAALVLNPRRGERTLATLQLRHVAGAALRPEPEPLAAALPLFAALACARDADLLLRNGAATALAIGVRA